MNFKKKEIPIIFKDLGFSHWIDLYKFMNFFTENRNNLTTDEIWLTEHYPVFTYGSLEKEYLSKNIKNIPVFYANRGGKFTYHGPGQLVVYLLIDLKRRKMRFFQLTNYVECLVMYVLYKYSIISHLENNFPGVFVNKHKICSLGFRVSRGCSFHGFSINVKMDLLPFSYINPCGYKNCKITQIYNFHKNISLQDVKEQIIKSFMKLKYCNLYF